MPETTTTPAAEADETDEITTQQYFENPWPGRDEALEQLVAKRLKLESAANKAAKQLTANYDAIKARMLILELDEYRCYDARKKVVAKPDDISVKVANVKQSEPTPYTPPPSAAAEG